MVDKDPAHELRRDSKKKGAVLPADPALVHELQIRLEHERCRGQRVIPFTAEMPPGHATQFVVHRINQTVGCCLIPITPRAGAPSRPRRLSCRSRKG
jgi:hypothetical protein